MLNRAAFQRVYPPLALQHPHPTHLPLAHYLYLPFLTGSTNPMKHSSRALLCLLSACWVRLREIKEVSFVYAIPLHEVASFLSFLQQPWTATHFHPTPILHLLTSLRLAHHPNPPSSDGSKQDSRVSLCTSNVRSAIVRRETKGRLLTSSAHESLLADVALNAHSAGVLRREGP